ncbi:kinase-like protein [Paxillus ammoniavirescens]|nr:kinase-like protein [Paxillus ammoniavirescens]
MQHFDANKGGSDTSSQCSSPVSPGVENDVSISALQRYPTPVSPQSSNPGEASFGEYDTSPYFLSLLCDAPPANFPLHRTALSHSHEGNCTPHRHASNSAGCNPPISSVESGSLLFSFSNEHLSPLGDSLPSTACFVDLGINDLRSRDYSPRFPDGHYLNPAFAQLYLVGDELGSGGYGFVMTALHRRLNSEVAVKFVIKEKVPEQAWINHDTLGRIPMEVMLLRIVNHENIVKCLDIFEDDLFFYVVQELHGSPWHKRAKSRATHHSSPEMSTAHLSSSPPLLSPAASEFSVAESEPDTPPQVCDQLSPIHVRGLESPLDDNILHNSVFQKKSGVYLDVPGPHYTHRPSHDLFECIEQTKHKRLSERHARYILAQVVEAVYYLDSRGITHRDIKDENLVIDKDFKVKLIDFGSATMVDPNQPRPFYNLFFGTTAYAASEVLLKRPYQAAPAEIWTIGVLMSYLLTGISPFPTEHDAIEGRIVLSELPGKSLSHSCLHLMSRCLEPDPSLRADIQEVRGHLWLKGALDGLSSWR